MKKWIFLIGWLTVGAAGAEQTKTVFNPHTGVPDFITKLDSTTLPSGSTQYIQNTSTIQSGSTFYVSSGAVSGLLNLTTDLDFGLGSTGGFNTYRTHYVDVGVDSADVSWNNSNQFVWESPLSTQRMTLQVGSGGGAGARLTVSSATLVTVSVSSGAIFTGNVSVSSTVALSNGSGTNGQVFTSGGPAAAASWTTIAGSGGSGYAVEPATITFNLAQGVIVGSSITALSTAAVASAGEVGNVLISSGAGKTPLWIGGSFVQCVSSETYAVTTVASTTFGATSSSASITTTINNSRIFLFASGEMHVGNPSTSNTNLTFCRSGGSCFGNNVEGLQGFGETGPSITGWFQPVSVHYWDTPNVGAGTKLTYYVAINSDQSLSVKFPSSAGEPGRLTICEFSHP